MELLGQINNLNLSPIKDYNKVLNNEKAFNLDDFDLNFEDILAKQTDKLNVVEELKGGVELNRIDDVAARNSVLSVDSSSPTGSFFQSMGNSITGGLNSVTNSIEAANKAQEDFAMGKDVSVHDVMIASEKASLSLSMAMQLRNKIQSAYNEINGVRV